MLTHYLYRFNKNDGWYFNRNQGCFGSMPKNAREMVYVAIKRRESIQYHHYTFINKHNYPTELLEQYGAKMSPNTTQLLDASVNTIGTGKEKFQLTDAEYEEYFAALKQMGYEFDYQICPLFFFVYVDFKQFHDNYTMRLLFLTLLRYAEEGSAGIQGILSYTRQGMDVLTASALVHLNNKYTKWNERYYAGSGHSALTSINEKTSKLLKESPELCFYVSTEHILKTVLEYYTNVGRKLAGEAPHVNLTCNTIMIQQGEWINYQRSLLNGKAA